MLGTGSCFNYNSFKRLFVAAVILSLTVAIFIGTKLGNMENRIIIPVSSFENRTLAEGILRVCLWDYVSFWLISLSLRGLLKILTSVSLFFFRGLILGNALRIFFANSVSDNGMLLLLSYSVVTLMLLLYDGFLNAGEEQGALCRTASCLIVTGGAAVIRLLPMLLIK